MKIIFMNIKNMLRRPIIFMILLIGLSVGSFAQIVYYVSSSAELRMGQVAFNSNRVIELSAHIDRHTYQTIIDLMSDGSLPPIHYAAFVSYEKEEYDVIAAVWNGDGIVLDSGGEYITAGHLGKKVATVSLDIEGFEEVQLKDSVKINGNSFEVVGVMSPGAHDPVLYDIRRMPVGAEYVTGVSIERDEFLLQRPRKAIIVPLDMLLDTNLTASYLHIAFIEEISPAQREEIESLIGDKTGNYNFTDLSAYSEVNYTNFWSKAVVSFAAIFAGIINVVALFAFFIRENKKQYVIYKMHGATHRRLFLLIALELALYTFIAFTIGWLGAKPFILYSGLVGIHMPFGILEFFLLFLVLFCIALFICLKQIQSVAKDPARKKRLHRRREKKIRLETNKDKKIITKHKFLYLLTFRYSKSGIISTLSICFLSVVVSFTLAYAMTYVYESSVYERYVHKVFPENTNILALFDETAYYFSEDSGDGPLRYDSPYYQEFLETVESLPNCIAVGEVRDSVWAVDTRYEYGVDDMKRNLELRQVNAAYMENSPLPLQKGSWEPLLNYDANDTDAPIPCVISPYLKGQYPVGNIFTLMVETDILESDGRMSPRQFVVAGIASDTSYTMIGNGLGPQAAPAITSYLRSFSSITGQSGGFFAQQVYIPIIQQDSGSVREFSPPLYLLYTDEDEAEAIPQWRLHLNRYASTVSIQECLDNYMEQFHSGGGNLYFMHAAVASALLILGVGGYSIMLFAANKRTYGIYYVCGMPWSKAAGLTVAGNALDMLLPAAVGAVAGVYVSQGIRVFDETTIALSILTGLGAVAALYALTSAIIALSMRKARPKRLMTENE